MVNFLRFYVRHFLRFSEKFPTEYTFPISPGLYIHVPFCRHFCDFCPYHKLKYEKEAADEYPELIQKEYALHIKRRYATLYIGGGTPSDDLELLEKVICMVKPEIDKEIALEIHPVDATPEKLNAIRKLGVNYVSLGIQSMNDAVLRYFGRDCDSLLNARALYGLASAGFDFVDIDLVFDPIIFSGEVIARDLRRIIGYSPDQISIYPMMRFAGTRFHDSGNDLKRELEVFEKLDTLALGEGYERKTLWTYTKKGRKKRYSSVGREFYLGLGLSAASFTGRIFAVNTFSPARYRERLDKSELPVSRFYRFSTFQGALYYYFWSLYNGKLNFKRLADLFPGAAKKIWLLSISMSLAGYLKKSDTNFLLTTRGKEKLHVLEEWLTYEFIDPIWAMLREENHPVPYN